MGTRELAFGPFTLDRNRMALLRDGKVLAIGQRGFALLWALAETDGTLSRTQLMEAVWPGIVVEEGNLNVQIAGLRKVLGPRPDGQDWIVTMARVGHHLVRDPAAPDFAPPYLSVIPFQTLGAGELERLVATGIVEDLVNALGRFRDFELKPGQAGPDPGAAPATPDSTCYRLEGAVRHVGSRLRITTHLVDGRTGGHIWSDSLDCADSDLFAVEDEVTDRVAGGAVAALHHAEIERATHATTPSAYLLYLQAVAKYRLLTAPGHVEGYGLLRRALELEPRHARALSHGAMLLADNRRMGWQPLTNDDTATCAAFIERAEFGDSDDSRVLAECANAILHGTREYRRAMELARRACAINPFCILALCHLGIASVHCGDLDEADGAYRRVARLSPNGMLLPGSLTGLAHVAMIRGHYEEALGWAEKSLALSARFDSTYWMLIAANAHLGHLDAARQHLTELLRRVPNETIAGIRAGQPDYDPGRMAAILDGLQLAGMP